MKNNAVSYYSEKSAYACRLPLSPRKPAYNLYYTQCFPVPRELLVMGSPLLHIEY